MRNTSVEADRVRLAKVRYFDEEENAVEIPVEEAYAFLVNVNGTYINPFNPLEEVPVYERAWYGNYTKDGEAYGTKIILKNGKVQEGMCYVLEKDSAKEIFEQDEISIKDMEEYILSSEKYFIDRLDITKKFGPREKLLRYRQMTSDVENKLRLEEYLNREKIVQKIK